MRIEASLRRTVRSAEHEFAVVAFGLRDARRRADDGGEPLTASRRAAERVVLRPIVASRQGTLVAPRGDWLLATFGSLAAAADAAVAVHQTLLAPVDPTLRRHPLSLRAAIDLALLERDEVGSTERDAFDGAHRLATSAEPGGLLLSSRAARRLGGAASAVTGAFAASWQMARAAGPPDATASTTRA